ncbi:hypothetical protein ACWDUL_20960 [Nocardia niigatensis]
MVEAIQALYRHTLASGGTIPDFWDAVVAKTYSDTNYGNGRRADNESGYDELRSARLVRAHAWAAQYSEDRAERLHDAVLGTGFDERTGLQVGRDVGDPVVAAVVGVDLQVLASPDSVPAAMDLLMKNAEFTGRHRFPPTWSQDIPQLRADNADLQHELGVDLLKGAITAAGAYARAEQHALAMRERYNVN